MTEFFAALPMYDWQEARGEVDAEWAALRGRLCEQGIDAPARLVRRNAEMPPVPGGIRDAAGHVIAADPATLPPEELDLPTLWRHPALLFGQACWGPLELGLAGQVRVVGQPDYSGYDGGKGELYASAILVRRDEVGTNLTPGAGGDGPGGLPLGAMRGARLAYNSDDSMSGLIALRRDLEAVGESLAIFSDRIETGAHRASVVALADEAADVCALDCRTWDLARRFEPKAAAVAVAGWTRPRKGLPYISSLAAPAYSLFAEAG